MKSTPVGLATCSYGANGTECLLSTSFGRFELTIGSITAAHGFAQKRTPVRHGADGRWPLAGDRFGLHGANCGRARRPLLVARLHPAPTRRGIGFDGEQSPAAGVRDWFARGAIASRCGSEETTGCGGGPPARGLGRRGRPWGAHPNALGRARQMPPCRFAIAAALCSFSFPRDAGRLSPATRCTSRGDSGRRRRSVLRLRLIRSARAKPPIALGSSHRPTATRTDRAVPHHVDERALQAFEQAERRLFGACGVQVASRRAPLADPPVAVRVLEAGDGRRSSLCTVAA